MVNRRACSASRKIPYVLVVLIALSVAAIGAGQRSVAPKKIESTDPALRLQWFEKLQAMRSSSPYKDLRWDYIGPDIISGRVTDVAVPGGSSRTIYVSSASGGVWKSVNAGTTWEPVLESGISSSIGDIAVSPSNPEILWVGLGEANILRSSLPGAGVYKSTDGGRIWSHVGLTGTNTIGRLIVHPSNPDIVYVAASGHEWTFHPDRGVYKTADGGRTWAKVLYIDDQTGAIDLVMDPSDHETLYAATWQRIRRRWSDPNNKPGYQGSGIHRTTDGGRTWALINDGLPPADLRGRIALDVSRSRPETLYALVDNQTRIPKPKPEGEPRIAAAALRPNLKSGEVYRSDDRGGHWTKVSPEDRSLAALYMYADNNWFGWGYTQIRVDPSNPDTVYVLGVGLLKSTDGGRTFVKLTYPNLHVDHHALWIDPADPKHLVEGNDGGLNISYDGGTTWQWCRSLPISQFYSLALDMEKPFNVYGSTQDHACYKGPVTYRPRVESWDRGPSPWTTMPGGEYSSVAVDPTDSKIYYSGKVTRSEFVNGAWKNIRVAPAAEDGAPPLRSQSLTPFILSPHNPSIITSGFQYVFRSLNRGDRWERISPDLTYNNPAQQDDVSFATITSISESPLKFGLLYAGTDDGRIQATQDHGRTWTDISPGLPFNKHVSRVTASAYREGTVYVSLNGIRDDDVAPYLFRSGDFGRTWADLSGGIPGGAVCVIREDPRKEGVLYAGTDFGVFVSTDSGTSWQTLGGNLPTVYVQDLVVHPRDPLLVIATHGRGMFVIDVSRFQKMP
jgi:photosystem II stability/assembly factor-like uncharacterized protein